MYDEAKRFGEAMVMTYVNDYGVDARIVRIFNTYGPRSDPRDGRLIPNLVRQALMGEPLTIYGDGLQTRSLCYVSDLVSGLVAAMESPGAKGRAINLGNPEEHPVVEYARLVADLTGTTAPFVSVPPAVGDDPQRRRPDISRARALLGWEPVVGLREGLASTIEAFRLELGIAAQPVSLAATG
jgi:nucleoside-diphosphate-sugar epimerase